MAGLKLSKVLNCSIVAAPNTIKVFLHLAFILAQKFNVLIELNFLDSRCWFPIHSFQFHKILCFCFRFICKPFHLNIIWNAKWSTKHCGNFQKIPKYRIVDYIALYGNESYNASCCCGCLLCDNNPTVQRNFKNKHFPLNNWQMFQKSPFLG